MPAQYLYQSMSEIWFETYQNSKLGSTSRKDPNNSFPAPIKSSCGTDGLYVAIGARQMHQWWTKQPVTTATAHRSMNPEGTPTFSCLPTRSLPSSWLHVSKPDWSATSRHQWIRVSATNQISNGVRVGPNSTRRHWKTQKHPLQQKNPWTYLSSRSRSSFRQHECSSA